MTVATTNRHASPRGYLERPHPSGLADVIDIILDKGLVIDAYVRVSLVGIEVLTIDARIVIASVDTYLRFAEATNRLDLRAEGGKDITELMGDSSQEVSEGKTEGIIGGAKDALFGDDDKDEDKDEDKGREQKRSSSSSSGTRRRRQREEA